MDRRVTGLALAGAIAAGGLALGAAAVAPALAVETPSPSTTASTDAADAPVADRPADRVAMIRDALDDLVDAGTIDADQADAVAAELAEDLPGRGGHGGPGHDAGGPVGGPGGRLLDLAVAADALGISPEELRTGLQDGRSLAEIADAEGAATEDLVAALVEAAQARLDELVTVGELTREQADERTDGLQSRVESFVDRTGVTGRGMHGGLHGGRGSGIGGGPAGPSDVTEPTAEASESSA